MDDAVEKYLNLTSYYGQQVEMDNEGRLLLPQILRGTARLDGGSCGAGKAASTWRFITSRVLSRVCRATH